MEHEPLGGPDRHLRLDVEARDRGGQRSERRFVRVDRTRRRQHRDLDRPRPSAAAHRPGDGEQLVLGHVAGTKRTVEDREGLVEREHPHAVDQGPADPGHPVHDVLGRDVRPVRDHQPARPGRKMVGAPEGDVGQLGNLLLAPPVALGGTPHRQDAAQRGRRGHRRTRGAQRVASTGDAHQYAAAQRPVDLRAPTPGDQRRPGAGAAENGHVADEVHLISLADPTGLPLRPSTGLGSPREPGPSAARARLRTPTCKCQCRERRGSHTGLQRHSHAPVRAAHHPHSNPHITRPPCDRAAAPGRGRPPIRAAGRRTAG